MKFDNRFLHALLLAGLASAPAVRADNGRAMPSSVPPSYTAECGACHVAYPPSLLPAGSWRRIMAGLDQHYGTDATLDATTLRELDTWLQAHAGTYKRVTREPPQDRITKSAWFERKHRGVEPAVWKLPEVKSPANCAACHGGAAQGRYDDENLRQPAGLTPRQRQAWND